MTEVAVASNGETDAFTIVAPDSHDPDDNAAFPGHASSSEKKDVLDSITGKVLDYYNSDHAFDFYHDVWGGEYLHVGLYSLMKGDDAKLVGVPRISKASYISTQQLLSRFFPSGYGRALEKCTVMDMGSGFGGTARAIAKQLGCKVICIGICKRENVFNARLNKDAGLEDKVIIPGQRSYFETGMPDSSCDVVCSQDALLLGGAERHRAIAEAARVLKPGGRMVFTDVMRSNDASAEDLKEVYERDGMETLSSMETYRRWGEDYGLDFVGFTDYTDDLVTHYSLVRDELKSRREDQEGSGKQFIDRTVKGVDAWVSGGRRGVIVWGFMVLQKPV